MRIGAMAMALLVSACAGAAVKKVTVGRHTFNVPEAYLVDQDLPFLPEDETQGLYVVLDPEAGPAERVSLIVETADTMCSFQTPPVIDQVPRACALARGQAPQPNPGRLTKTPRPGSTNQYDYKGEDGGVAVSCRGEPGRSATCSATFAWRDLVWDASFDEGQVARLDQIRADVASRLDTWVED